MFVFRHLRPKVKAGCLSELAHNSIISLGYIPARVVLYGSNNRDRKIRAAFQLFKNLHIGSAVAGNAWIICW